MNNQIYENINKCVLVGGVSKKKKKNTIVCTKRYCK